MSTDPQAADASPVTPQPPIFHSDSPTSFVNWFEEHVPDSRQVIVPHHVSRHSGVPNPTPHRFYSAEAETKHRDHLLSFGEADAAADADGAPLDEDLDVEYSRTLVCNASRALLWRAMMAKIRNPAAVAPHVKSVKILFEGVDVVYREIDVGLPGSEEKLKEKVTWDEADESVRFTLYEDPTKEGYIENAISRDASGQMCLTLSCHWTFHPHSTLTPVVLAQWRQGLRQNIDRTCAATVHAVEEEAKAVEKERRRRHSLAKEDEKTLAHIAAADEKHTAAPAASPTPDTQSK